MRWVWLAVCLAGACYKGPDGAAPCSITCTDSCPGNMTCTRGLCVHDGETCGADAGADAFVATCGEVGMACCTPDPGPACVSNAFCSAGMCQQCAIDVTLGRWFSCVLEHDHTVWCVGDNGNGELGNNMPNVASTSFVQVKDAAGPITDATAVVAGHGHACALRTGGAVWCWGYNFDGEIGDPSYTNQPIAVQVQGLPPITELALADYTSCALDANAHAWCWGYGGYSNLGDGTITTRNYPSLVLSSAGVTFENVKHITAGDNSLCLQDSSDVLWCWGKNNYGQLGDGVTTTDSAFPITTNLATSQWAVGEGHACAIANDGTTQCWGRGARGWIGNGTLNGGPKPATVIAYGGMPYMAARSLAMGAVSCALTAQQGVDCWGKNNHGQAGNGAGSLVPSPVLGSDGKPLTKVARVVAHHAHACAFRTTGELVCWGRNSEGQLGDGTTTNIQLATPPVLTCQ